MPADVPEKLLRGTFASMVRGGESSPSAWSINKKLKTTPPTYNNVKSADVNLIEKTLKGGPFPKAGMTEFGFEYWYNYFFKEVPDTEKVKYASHVVNDDGSFRNESSKSAGEWKKIYSEMLDKGFQAFGVGDLLTAKQALIHAADTKKSGNQLQRDNVQVAFRGDGRPSNRIKGDKGTARQTKVDFLRSQRNMTKAWHPFNKQGHKVWVRKGFNADNCLFSAVSITPQFGVATKFPLLDDLRGSNPGAIGHSIVRVRARRDAPAPRGAMSAAERYKAAAKQGGDEIETITLLASQTNIYCVRLRDVYNTQKFQKGSTFPEYATTRISWMDHVLWFGVTRIHFSELNANAGHLIVITGHKWLQPKDLIANVILSTPGLRHLEAFANDIVHRGSLINGVGGIVYTPPGAEAPLFEIVSIRELFVAGRQATVPPTATAAHKKPTRTPGKVTIPSAFRKT